jgi:hypothetical protein
MPGSAITAKRHVVGIELLIAQQKAALDQLVRDGRSKRDVDLARSVLASLESKLRFAEDHLRFERHRYGPPVEQGD